MVCQISFGCVVRFIQSHREKVADMLELIISFADNLTLSSFNLDQLRHSTRICSAFCFSIKNVPSEILWISLYMYFFLLVFELIQAFKGGAEQGTGGFGVFWACQSVSACRAAFVQTAFLGQAKFTTCITMSAMCVCVFLGVAVLDFAVSLSSGSDETLCHHAKSPELKITRSSGRLAWRCYSEHETSICHQTMLES